MTQPFTNDLCTQLAAISAEIAAKSNFKGCTPYIPDSYNNYHPIRGSYSAGNSSVSSLDTKYNSSESNPKVKMRIKNDSTSSSNIETTNNLPPSAILAAVKNLHSQIKSEIGNDSKLSQQHITNTQQPHPQSNRPNRRSGRHEGRFTSGKNMNIFHQKVLC